MLHRKHPYILFVLAVALLVVVNQAQALFTVEYTIKNNVIKTGRLAIAVSPEEGLLNTEALLPGQSVSNTMHVTNTGTSPIRLELSAKKSAGYKALYETLMTSISYNDQLIFEGKLNDLNNISLTPDHLLDPQKTDEYKVTVRLPLEADSTIDNLYANIALTIVGIQNNG